MKRNLRIAMLRVDTTELGFNFFMMHFYLTCIINCIWRVQFTQSMAWPEQFLLTNMNSSYLISSCHGPLDYSKDSI